jgi:peptidase E
MRLFLASQDFGNHADRLREMVGENRRALVVFNARDYETPEGRRAVVERKRKLFADNGFEFRELDLRDYFGKKDELAKFVDDFKPGLVSSQGGNTFLFKAACDQSEFAEILLKDLTNDKYVYCGHSAGAMAASPDYHSYNAGDNRNRALEVKKIYGIEPDFGGLHLVDEYFLPHAGQAWHKDIFDERLGTMEANGVKPVVLRDSDVFVVDGDRTEVLR